MRKRMRKKMRKKMRITKIRIMRIRITWNNYDGIIEVNEWQSLCRRSLFKWSREMLQQVNWSSICRCFVIIYFFYLLRHLLLFPLSQFYCSISRRSRVLLSILISISFPLSFSLFYFFSLSISPLLLFVSPPVPFLSPFVLFLSPSPSAMPSSPYGVH